ncbi:MAG: glutathione S-transferase N-terminal domain-containing protein [Deltaproteobacteria bacterium]|nr:glutathione S-transferase N-terminal domain-containing protein [Deltaproteobacteria bacterium]
MLELYDLVGKNDQRFSPFCWRTKAVLAYKKIPYTTVPIRFTDKDKLAFSGQGRVPVIKNNGTVVCDSWTIAEYLEEQQPDPRIFPGLGLKEACRFFNLYVDRTVHPALFPLVVADIFAKVDPVDREYFRTSREERLGMTLEAIAARRAEYRPRLQAVLADLEATISGQDYFFGLLTYADLCLFGTFKWVTAVSEEPLFDSAPALRAWWGRMREWLGL